jgi:DNA mismatch repair protein MLH3
MLNNLASSFQSSITRRNEEIDVQSRKRQKTDMYPAFLLNFRCSRSSYDLHFEPAKTVVEFKVIRYNPMLLSFLVCNELHLWLVFLQ